MQKQRIYLDNGASTQLDRQVLQVMLPFWTETYGNSSSHHSFGRQAEQALEEARTTVAKLLGAAASEEIVFTGCGSESDNLAVRGAMWAARAHGKGNHLITSCIEHSAVGQTAVSLHTHHGFDLTILPVDHSGQVRPADLEAAIRPDTVLVSIMAANNEIGTLQPIDELGAIAHAYGALFHTDAVQAVAVQRWQLAQQPIDLLSVAPHKFYGPKGMGMLYVRQGVELQPELTGGSHENGLRAGTVNVPFAVGAAKALELAMADLPETVAHYQRLRDRLIEGVLTAVPDNAILTGHPTHRLPHNASFAFRHLSGNDLLMHLDMAGIAASSGSACKSGDPKPSAVLEALGLGREWTKGGLRLTVGRHNTMDEIEQVVATLPRLVAKLQKIHVMFA
ncbi:MAG: cysteine desulfurase [Ardenticatenaceae bacterium]|nr:cysteine desulfurase [Ardenticatenaceae bacterium]